MSQDDKPTRNFTVRLTVDTSQIDAAIERLGEHFSPEALSALTGTMTPLLQNIQSIADQLADIFGAEPTDPRDMTPEQRWQYQKYILSAPLRWFDFIRTYLENKFDE